MKKKTKIIVLATIGVIAYYTFQHHNAAKAPLIDTVTVKLVQAKEMPLPIETHVIGTLSARSVEITPEAAGHVAHVLFRDGTAVKAGQVLIQLNDAVYRAKYESAKAQLAYSQANYNRMQLLAKKGIVSQQALDQASADFKEKTAAANENEVLMNEMKLAAPFDGVVSKSKVNPGDYVTVGQSLVTLTDTQHLHVEYTIPEKYLPMLKLGQAVTITAAAYPDKMFTGKVAYIAPTINTDNRSVSLYAEIPNPDNLLAAGMFVNISQSLGTDAHALMIPARSLVPILDGAQVYRVTDGKAYAVNVQIGKRTEELVQILAGLTAGDTIVTDGQLKLKNGVSIKE